MKNQVSNQITQSQSPLDQEPVFAFVKGLMEAGETNSAVVATLWASTHRLSTTEKSIRRFRIRHHLEPNHIRNAKAGYKLDGDEGELVSHATPHNPMDDPDAML